ncbi:MAG TPA: papain-like cysteine protease family protein [Xanthobacteraceae bacterium]
MRMPSVLYGILCSTVIAAIFAPPSAIAQTSLTVRSYPIAAGASAGNLDGTACPVNTRMISGACHPFYNAAVPIINQYPNASANTWRCGFKNNTTASVSVYVYTVCAAAQATSVCTPAAQGHLAVTLQPQQTDMWCWAASGQMIMGFLGVSVQQCTEANNEFGRSDCCNASTPSACVNGGWPEFDKYGFTFARTSGVALTWTQLQNEISDAANCGRRPVAFAWHWVGGGGHMMVAIGYQTIANVNYVEINNPWAPNVGDHRFITYDFYVASAGDHTHWDDFYQIKKK